MPSFAEMVARLPQRTPLLGLDLGTKTIGVAISDLTRQIASPLETIARKKFSIDAAQLLEIITREKAGLIVLGLPLNMDGTEGPRAQSTRAFARNLEKLTDIPLVFWDERLSTMAVEKAMIKAGASRAKRADHIDKLAAAYILQSALDSLK
jgi:putative Holliday junction resolvase